MATPSERLTDRIRKDFEPEHVASVLEYLLDIPESLPLARQSGPRAHPGSLGPTCSWRLRGLHRLRTIGANGLARCASRFRSGQQRLARAPGLRTWPPLSERAARQLSALRRLPPPPAPTWIPLCGKDAVAQRNALIADVDTGAGDQLLARPLRFLQNEHRTVPSTNLMVGAVGVPPELMRPPLARSSSRRRS
jgi:hypothetical protein